MKDLVWPKKLISIESIMDFDLDTFSQWIKDVNLTIVYIGYDNYNNSLPEPASQKTHQLIERLEAITDVRLKTMR